MARAHRAGRGGAGQAGSETADGGGARKQARTYGEKRGSGKGMEAGMGAGMGAGGDMDSGLLFKIENVQASIFDYELANVSNNVVNIFTQIVESGVVSPSDAPELSRLNQLMSACLSAMQASDYLLLADLLEFELKPLIGAAPAAVNQPAVNQPAGKQAAGNQRAKNQPAGKHAAGKQRAGKQPARKQFANK
jgi:hypothetical protein